MLSTHSDSAIYTVTCLQTASLHTAVSDSGYSSREKVVPKIHQWSSLHHYLFGIISTVFCHLAHDLHGSRSQIDSKVIPINYLIPSVLISTVHMKIWTMIQEPVSDDYRWLNLEHLSRRCDDNGCHETVHIAFKGCSLKVSHSGGAAAEHHIQGVQPLSITFKGCSLWASH